MSKIRPVKGLSKDWTFLSFREPDKCSLFSVLPFDERFPYIPDINFGSLNLTYESYKGLCKIRPLLAEIRGLSKIRPLLNARFPYYNISENGQSGLMGINGVFQGYNGMVDLLFIEVII